MSLIEAMIAVAISVLIAALAFPAMDRALESSQQAGAATTLLANIRVARAQAVRGGAPVAVTIAPDGEGYAIGGSHVQLPDRLRLTGRPARLTFHADGSATAGRIILKGARRTQIFRILPTTGLIVQAAPQ